MDLYVEYYLSRGMSIDDFGPNLSFSFLMELTLNMQLLVEWQEEFGQRL